MKMCVLCLCGNFKNAVCASLTKPQKNKTTMLYFCCTNGEKTKGAKIGQSQNYALFLETCELKKLLALSDRPVSLVVFLLNARLYFQRNIMNIAMLVGLCQVSVSSPKPTPFTVPVRTASFVSFPYLVI